MCSYATANIFPADAYANAALEPARAFAFSMRNYPQFGGNVPPFGFGRGGDLVQVRLMEYVVYN